MSRSPSVIYHCPNCGSGLTFAPETQNFRCEYCRSDFSEADLASRQSAPPSPWSPAERVLAEMEPLPIQSYRCPSCGSEIIGDDTTAATSCIYCHNPVVLAGQLSGTWKPDSVIPFAIAKADAVTRFRTWIKSHRFTERHFFDTASMDNLHGLYAPFWIVEGSAKGRMLATGTKVRVWTQGNTEYTETSTYDVTREGDFSFADLTFKALNKQSADLIDGIFPYDLEVLQPFSMAYLSGFLAEKRNLEKIDLENEAADILSQSGRSELRGSISGYSWISENSYSLSLRNDIWRYALMPVWLLSCRYKGRDYCFAMNGQTGKVAGQLPPSWKKLSLLFAAIFGVVSGLVFVFLTATE